MREILFRGKGTHGFARGKWIYGNYAKDFWGEQHKGFGIHPKEGGYSEVDPETVGQYTGLTDKNGTKIFEGDILKSVMWWLDDAKNGVVTFRDGAFGFIWYRGKVEMFHPFTSVCNIEYEVIGNIHDNPELLKGGVEE